MIVTYQSNEINNIWHKVEPFIRNVLQKFEKDYTINSIKESLLKADTQLWTSQNEKQIQGICLTTIAIYPTHKICQIFMVSGSNFKDWKHEIEVIKCWAKSIGCKYIRMEGRKGWLRKLDWRHTKVIMEQEL